jgi:hypothetical protein
LVITVTAASSANVFISEIASAGHTNTYTEEYVEISNNGGSGADMTGWTLEYYNSSDVVEGGAVILSGTLAAGDAWVIAARTGSSLSPDFTGNFPMNSNCYVKLKDNGTIVDEAGTTTSDEFSQNNFEFTDCGASNLAVSSWVDHVSENGTPGVMTCVVVGPTITVSTATLTGFTYVFGSGPSTEQTFTVEGSDLTNDIILTAPANYEISETSGGGYTSPITLTQGGGAVSSTTIYIRLKIGLAVNTYNSEVITASSTGATDKTLTSNGEVTAPDVTAPLVTTLSPLDNATGVAINTNLVLTFDETVQAGAGNILIKEVSGDATFQTIAIGSTTISGSTVTISHNDFAYSTEYYVEIASGVITDAATSPNNYAGLSGSTAWSFTTMAEPVVPSVFISEVADKGFLGDFNDEYIELTNTGGSSQDISSWTLEYYSSGTLEGGVQYLTGSIAAGSAYLIAARSTSGTIDGVTPNFTCSGIAMNSVSYVIIKDGSSSIIDQAGSNGDQFDSGENYEFINCGTDNLAVSTWVDLAGGNGTPGAINCIVTNQEINIQENTTDYLTGSTYDFGNVENGSSSSIITFTIQNTGSIDLDISGTPKVAISGTNASEFTIDETSTSATVSASGTTTFTITFSPTSVATGKTAAISIANDDVTDSEDPYVINLTGIGTAPDVTAPTVSTYNPDDESTGVSVATDLILTFDENVQKGTGNIYIKLVSDNSTIQTIDVTNATVTVSGTSVTINPPSDLATLTAYYIIIDSGAIEDIANNDYTGISASTTWNFTTADVLSTTTCIDEDFESGLSTSYVDGELTLSDGNWLFENGGFKSTTNKIGVAACQIQNASPAFAATPILYNVQTVIFWFYDGDIPIVKYGTAIQTVDSDPLETNGAGQWSKYSVTINASTSERVYFYSDGFTGYLDDVSTICEVEPCIPPVITAQPSTSTETVCKSTTVTDLSVTDDGTGTAYQWYSNTSAANNGGTLLSGATASTYTPVISLAGTLYYYCVITSSPSSCTVTSDVSGAIIVKANPRIDNADITVCELSTLALFTEAASTPAASNPWVSATTANVTVTDGGVATGVAAGTSVITYTDIFGCVDDETITVDPGTPTITGTANVCVGLTTTLSGDPTGGTWSSGNTALATVNSSTGVVTGVADGSPVITYTTGCGSDDQTVTVNALPTISGTLAVCGGYNTTLTAIPAGGSWSSASTGVATINAGTGEVTGVSTGTSVITYTALTGCEETETVSVTAPTISGSTAVNIGGQITLTGTPAGGTWSSGTPANATINSSTGVVTGVASGTSLITYAISGCDATTTVTSSTGPCLGPEGFTSTTAPAGWTFTDIVATYTDADFYGDASPSIRLDDDNHPPIIETPTFANASELSFYCNTQWAGSTSKLLIEGWDGSSWLTVDNLLIPETDATGYITYNASSTPALQSGFNKFRFTFEKLTGNAGFDDVTVYCDPLFHEIELSANGNAIIDGDDTPAASDFTDFGNAAVTGETVDRTFTIHNFGTENLNLTGIPIVVATGDFTVTSQPSSSTISGSSSLTFTVQFDPTTTGVRTGTISIANDDPNENPYNFDIQGTGLASSSPWLVDEKFDNVSSIATITNTNTAGFTATGTGLIAASWDAAAFNRSANALTFLGGAGSSVIVTTPVFANADMLSFWYKQPNAASTNVFLIEQYSPAKAGWTTVATIPGGAASLKPAVYFYPLAADITQIRFTYTRTDVSYQGFLDDVRIRKASYCTSDIKIIQTLVQSCGGSEGINESVVFKTGSDPINVSDLSVSWPNVGVGGTEYSADADQGFVTNASYITDLNDLVQLTYPVCSPVLAPPGGIIPSDSYAVIFSGSSPDVTYDFKDACISGTNYYAIFCDNTNTTGRYGNTPVPLEKDYTAIIDKATGCYDSQYYDNGIPNTPGALALYDETTRARTYDNFGCEIIVLLPVELESFEAWCFDDYAIINWATASEKNNDYFELQKSNDGYYWYNIAVIDGAGNSNSLVNYSYSDKLYDSNITYYRLKQVDFDSKFEYSNIIFSDCSVNNNTDAILYPNPCNGLLNVSVKNWYAQSIKIEILDMPGQIVWTTDLNSHDGFGILELNTNMLKPGMYFIRLSDKNASIIKKFVKQ